MSTQAISYRNSCRLCGSADVRKFLHFDSIPFFDEVIPLERLGKEFVAPMDVYWCGDCHSVQSQHDVNISSYYNDYQYVASHSVFIRSFMEVLAQEVFTRYGMKSGDCVLEVGSADGFQLACFRNLGAKVLGFEPAENLCELSRERGVDVIPELFTAESVPLIPEEFKKVQAFILLHTFDHLLDPKPFIDSVKMVLDPERGVLILEVHDLSEIMKRSETSLFGHEHATFLHLGTMKRFLEKSGFVLLDANFIPEEKRRGNSMLITAGLQGCGLMPMIEFQSLDYEWLETWDAYQNFEFAIESRFANFRDSIRKKVAEGSKIAGYGAWGRGVTTLAMAKLTANDFMYICDRNAFLHGKYTPGSQIPIASPDDLLVDVPDEVIVFNYGYIEEIREQLVEYTKRGGVISSILDYLNP